MLAHNAEAAWQSDRTCEFVERERSRGHFFRLEHGEYRRLDGLAYAHDQKLISLPQLTAGRRYARDFNTFVNFGRFPSTLAYLDRPHYEQIQDTSLGAGLRLREVREVLSWPEIQLADLVCGRGVIAHRDLLAELAYLLTKLSEYYGRPTIEIDEADFRVFAPVVLSLREEAAKVHAAWKRGYKTLAQIGLQALLYRAQGGHCSICNGRVPSRYLTIDHVRPKGTGGFDGPGNVLIAHERCNYQKRANAPKPRSLAMLRQVNALLGWDDPHDDAREMNSVQDRIMDALARLDRLKDQPLIISPRARLAVLPEAEPEPSESGWSALLPAKPSRSDDTMAQSWLAGAGVVKANRNMRHLGVQAKAAVKRKARAKGRKRRPRHAGNS